MTSNSILKTRRQLCKLHLLLSAIFYIVVCLFGLEMNFGLMTGYGIYSFCIITLLLKSEMRFEGFTLVIIFLAGSYLRLIIPTISYALSANDGALFKFKYDYTDALFPCSIAMNIYYMLFILLLTYYSKTNRILSIDLTSLSQKKHILRILVIFYVWGWGYTYLSESFGIGFLGMFFDNFSSMALLMLAFVSVYRPNGKYYYTFVILIILEVIRTVVWGFYKGAIITPLFIFAIHYYFYHRYYDKKIITVKSALLLAMSLLFMLGFVYPFMTAKRAAAGWDLTNGITQDFDVKEILITIFENRDQLLDEDHSSSMLGRFDALCYNAYFYKLVQREGINPIFLYASVRQFWPKWLGRNTEEDILMRPGFIATSYIWYGDFRKLDDYSGSYVGAFASGYFWGWWIGVLAVCVFNAYVISWLLRFCFSHSTNYLCMLVLTSIVLEAFGCYEEVKSGGISRTIIWFILIIVAILFILKKK